MSLQGLILSKYRILTRIGEGGMGSVYRARDELLDRDVAIKVLRPDLAGQHALVERFRSEAIALARLGHPRIAMLHGLERDGEQLLMVMEFVHGETLESLIQRGGPVPWRRAAELCMAVCEALDHAHEQGVVHRDIKPANVMLTRGGHIKVMDFGIARVMGRRRQTQLGRSVGTPMYMAPEQLRGEEVDGRADTYALGTVLYELITGKVPFDADSDYSLMMKQLNEPPPRPSLSVAGLPSEIDEIVTRAMAKRREDRFPSAAAMRGALETAVKAVSIPSRELRPVPAPPPASVEPVKEPVATRLADQEPAPGPTRLAEPSSPAAPPTRLADPSAPAAPPTRLAGEPLRPGLSRWLADWRPWAAAAAVILAVTLAVRASRTAPERILSETPPPAPVEAAPPSASSGVSELVTAPVRPTRDPRLEGARPIGPKGGGPAPAEPPSRGGPVPPAKSGGAVVPAPPPPPSPEPAADPNPARPAVDREAILGAVRTWVAGIGAHKTNSLPGLDPSPKPHAQLLDLMKTGRVSVAAQEPAGLEIGGSVVTATVTTTLSHRSPFGASHRTPVRFALTLSQNGSGWRVVQARILGTPRLD